jgi:hypothetical protein
VNLEFDLDAVEVTEFGVGLDAGDGQSFLAVPVDHQVQAALGEMVALTWENMLRDTDEPPLYSPSEKHGSVEYLHLPIGHELASSVRDLHQADNLDLDAGALDLSDDLFCYFARLSDDQGRRLTALRRATHFKGVLKKRLIRIDTDALKLIEDRVFKLDNDFDLVVDGVNVHILRPSGFEFAGRLQQAILDAVPVNAEGLQHDLGFVDLDPIAEYARIHPRAARYLASIHGQQDTENIDKDALVQLCRSTGVDVQEADGKLRVDDGHEMGFLEVLDRRRYELLLVREQPERYRASSRSKIDG